MSKFKSPLILLLSAALILFGAMLPKTVAAIQDDVDITQVNYAPISEVHLEFDNDVMTMKEKFMIMHHDQTNVPVPAKLCTRTEDNIMELAQDTIAAYTEAGLIPFSVDVLECLNDCKAYLGYSYYTETSFVYWSVVLSNVEWSDWMIYLRIDDETGAVMQIECLHQATLYELPLDDKLDTFCQLYLKNLGTEFEEFDNAYLKKHMEATSDRSTLYCYLSWQDETMENVTLYLTVNEYGFHSNLDIETKVSSK